MNQNYVGDIETAQRQAMPATPVRPWTALGAGLAILVVSGLIAGRLQPELEYPILTWVNSFARHSAAFDRVVHALTMRELLQGVVFMSLIWYLWFDSRFADARPRLLAGVGAAVGSGIISRLLQIGLPTHLRPLYTPALAFVRPIGVDHDALNHFNSFPSDHGAVFFTLALLIFRERPAVGIAAFLWAVIVDVARVYDGYHYPSDIVGSIGLGLVIITLCDQGWVRRLADHAVAFEARHRPAFYLLAFAASYQIATLFDDIREMARGTARLLLHHDPFQGG